MFLWMDVERREGNVSTKPQRDLQEMCGRAVGFTWLQVHIQPHSGSLKEAGLVLMDGIDFLEFISKDKHNYQNCSLPMNYPHGVWFPRMEDLLCQKFQKYQNKPK